MTAQTKKLLGQAMKLSEEERWKLTDGLLESLQESERDADHEAAWAAEIERRIKEVESGQAKTIPWEEVRRSILGLEP